MSVAGDAASHIMHAAGEPAPRATQAMHCVDMRALRVSALTYVRALEYSIKTHQFLSVGITTVLNICRLKSVNLKQYDWVDRGQAKERA